MSVCYHLQSRSGVSKKSGNWFGCTTMLFRDQYGNWTSDTVFWTSKDDWDASEVVLAEEGTPIKILRSDDGHRIAVLNIREDVEPLSLAPA